MTLVRVNEFHAVLARFCDTGKLCRFNSHKDAFGSELTFHPASGSFLYAIGQYLGKMDELAKEIKNALLGAL